MGRQENVRADHAALAGVVAVFAVIERAAEAYGKKGKIEAQHLAFELTELFASGDLTPQDMDGIMYEMHKAYFMYREQKREKERIMNL